MRCSFCPWLYVAFCLVGGCVQPSLHVHQYPFLLCKTFYPFHRQPVVYVVKETFYVKVYYPAIRKTVLPALPARRKITATCHPVPQFVQQLFLLPVKPFSRHPICSACSLVTAYFPVRCRYLFHTDGITPIFFLSCWLHLSNSFPFYKAVLNDFTRLAR